MQRYLKSKSFRFGVPFLLLMVGGSFGLQQFAQLRYTFSKKGTLTPEEAEKFGVNMKKAEEVTLETEYEKIKTIDIDNWQNVRGPRPWEDTVPNEAVPN
ncbi:cytochrome c oxidase assembly protein COX16 homolog, mitochondrial-like [Uranotaenia lowii]|uniref:cytochrome c oxidase assembly protein COX16 homolog, mitochondrial-like n=1 Tax=Uranotaenia lowii TaxID=190385 RepID=UPI0024798067|nr:cytochrome c oxidase assembly protein COX16 homolog, mitochondrial-like [Uranotaenia lowii]XP_055609509.1 cytochrome c oxidase assembly protein COX16 homolog, mitochondrial-like [Uranotaenia lowii]